MHYPDWKKYVTVFSITLTAFLIAFAISSKLSTNKIDDLRAIQDRISLDLLSSEMQFTLLAEAPCDETGSSLLSPELNDLGNKLSYAEANFDAKQIEILSLKKSYTLLEIKDFLLTKKLAEKCKTKPATILYFYSNKGDCPDCEREGIVLTHLRATYPNLRVYSFDYDLDLSAKKTLISLYKINRKLPAVVIDGKVLYGFNSVEQITVLSPNMTTTSTTSTIEIQKTTSTKKVIKK